MEEALKVWKIDVRRAVEEAVKNQSVSSETRAIIVSMLEEMGREAFEVADQLRSGSLRIEDGALLRRLD